jgi:putative acetyltransferase
MDFVSGHIGRERDIYKLFSATFTASEGAEEGELIGKFVNELMEKTPDEDLFVFSAYVDGNLVGSIFFSRLNYERDSRTVFILSPVAVKTTQQKKGIGKKLIAFGLNELRRNGIDIAITYGDPNYYLKLGFRQITKKFDQAPLELNYPEGWLAQSLAEGGMEPLGYCQLSEQQASKSWVRLIFMHQ